MNTIPLDAPVVTRIKTIIPPHYHALSWIGGSAATNWGQNGDVDVWVCVPQWSDVYALQAVIEALGHTPNPDEMEHYIDTLGSAMLYSYDGLHILATMGIIQDVVARFDISCHAAAINLITGEMHRHPQYTPLVRPLDYMSARKTFARLLKFAARYDDQTIWLDPTCQKLAIATFHLPHVTQAEAAMVKLLRLPEGM